MKNKIILTLVFLVFIQVNIKSQDFNHNLQKYWVYRERLKNFVVIGDCQGCSLPADARQAPNHTMSWDDASQRIGYYIGFLATEYKLLLNSSSPSTYLDSTKRELFYAISALNRLDWTSEYWWKKFYNHQTTNLGPVSGNDLNGFFIRDDVPQNDNTYYNGFSDATNLYPINTGRNDVYTNGGSIPHTSFFTERPFNSDLPYLSYTGGLGGGPYNNYVGDYLNKSFVPLEDEFSVNYSYDPSWNVLGTWGTQEIYADEVINSGFKNGIECGVAPEEESLDQMIELMVGLSLVVKLVPATDVYGTKTFLDGESTFVTEAQNIVERMVTYASTYTGIRNTTQGWCLVNPAVGPINCVQATQCNRNTSSRECSVISGVGGGNFYGMETGFADAYYEVMSNFTTNSPCTNCDALVNGVESGDENLFKDGCTISPDQCDKFNKLYVLSNYWGSNAMTNLCGGEPDNNATYHLPMILNILYGTTGNCITNQLYECMLNSAPNRGTYNCPHGTDSEPISTATHPCNYQWNNDRIYSGLGNDARSNNEELYGLDYLWYFSLYCLYNPSYVTNGGGFNYISPMKLAIADIGKTNYTERGVKNFIASHNITAGNLNNAGNYVVRGPEFYTEANSSADVKFIAGNLIQLLPGFSCEPQQGYGGHFRFAAYIDNTITAQDLGTINDNAACVYNGYRTRDTTTISNTPKKSSIENSLLGITDTNKTNLNMRPIKFEVIPNPNNGTFSLSSSSFSASQGLFYFSVADAIGNIIVSERIYNIGDVINAEMLQNGVYYLNLRGDNTQIIGSVKKLIITK